MSSAFDQSRYAVRLAWGLRGAREVLPGAAAVAVVDVLSFTTAVAVAVERGIAVRPLRWGEASAAEIARSSGAVLAVWRSHAGPGSVSLSPASLARAQGVSRVVLPSPNGATICAEVAGQGVPVVAACLRTAHAVAARLARVDGPVAVVPAGERWGDDDSLRPALEDELGAGAVVAALLAARPGLEVSPEAGAAAAAYGAVRGALLPTLQRCGSGRELIERGYPEDVEMAADADCTDVVPLLVDGWFVAAD